MVSPFLECSVIDWRDANGLPLSSCLSGFFYLVSLLKDTFNSVF